MFYHECKSRFFILIFSFQGNISFAGGMESGSVTNNVTNVPNASLKRRRMFTQTAKQVGRKRKKKTENGVGDSKAITMIFFFFTLACHLT